MSHWILVEAEHPENYEHVVCGPFDTEAEAVHHLQDSLQVQGWCDDDALDAWVVETDTDKDDVVRQWAKHGDNWGLYVPIRDDDQTFLNDEDDNPEE
jgi:hypothetical protein